MRQMKNGVNNDPEFIIFTGPMFGSKTTRLLAAVDRYRYQNKRVIAFKPLMDDRYSHTDISTHSGGSLSAVCVRSGDEIIENVSDRKEDFDVVAVDEAFMLPNAGAVLRHPRTRHGHRPGRAQRGRLGGPGGLIF